MGHIVNPLAFRLGRVNFWKYNYYHFNNHNIFFYHFFFSHQLNNLCNWIFKDNYLNFFLQRFRRMIKKNYFILLESLFLFLFNKDKLFYVRNKNILFYFNYKIRIFTENTLSVLSLFFNKFFKKKEKLKNKNLKLFNLKFLFFNLKKRNNKKNLFFNFSSLKDLLFIRKFRYKKQLKLIYTIKKNYFKFNYFTLNYFYKKMNLFIYLLFYYFSNYKLICKFKQHKEFNKKKKLKISDIKFNYVKRRLFLFRKIFNHMYLNQNTKPYGNENLLDQLLIEKLNYYLLQLLTKTIRNFIKRLKLKLKLMSFFCSNVRKKFFSRLMFINDLSSLKIFYSSNVVKINFNFSHPELLTILTSKFLLINVKTNNLKIKLIRKIKCLFINLNKQMKIYLYLIFFTSYNLKLYSSLKYLFFYIYKYILKLKSKYIHLFNLSKNFFSILKINFKTLIKSFEFDLKDLFIERFLNKIIISNLKLFFNKLFKSKLFFFNINILKGFLLNSNLIFKFIFKQLKRNKSLMKIIYSILSEIKKQPKLLGFKILTSGRFTRRERALFKVWIHKKLAFSNVNIPLDYCAGNFKSKFGMCSIRIWLFHKI